MKIRSKLFLSFILLAGFTAILATFFAIYSISQEHETLAIDDIITTRNDAENTFYEYLGELTKKAAFLSELSEIIDNTKNPDELIIALENKSFYLYNLNVKVIDPDLRIIMSYNNSTENIINQKNLKSLPFFKQQRDPLLRDTGIFKINNQICMIIISPIVDQRIFNFKAYLLFELYLNSEFSDQLKDKIKGDIVIISSKEKLANFSAEKIFKGVCLI